MEKIAIPRDELDPCYVQSFSVDDAINSLCFYEEWGFVVFRDVFNNEECQKTREAMWEIIEIQSPGFLRHDPSTWDELKAAGKYGLSSRGPSFHPQLVTNRQNPALAQALSSIMQVASDDLMVSHDRFTIYRATMMNNPAFGDCTRFRTGKRNVHLDLNPWWWGESSKDILIGANSLQYNDRQDFIKENNLVVQSMGPHVQCVINFADNLDSDGGTLIIPKFHKHCSQWATDNAKLRKPVPFITFGKDGEACENHLLELAQRIPMRQGSALMWNQTVMHGTEPNASANTRMAQFLKAFSRSGILSAECDEVSCQANTARLARRARALQKALEEHGSDGIVTGLGMRMFGLDA